MRSPSGHPLRFEALLVLLLATLISASAVAQVAPGLPYSGALQAYVQAWRVEDAGTQRDIAQLVVPIGVFLPVSDGYEIRLSTAYVGLTRQLEGSEKRVTISGPADVKLQASGALLNRRLLVGLVANLPTGQRDLTGEEQDVVLSFIAPDLSVRAARFGEGLNVGGNVSYGLAPSGDILLALGGAFIYRGAYDITFPSAARSVSLTPGFEATVTSSVFYPIDDRAFRGSVGFTMHGMEKIDGSDAYQLGPRVFGEVSYAQPFEAGRGRLSFLMRDMYRFEQASGDVSEVSEMLDTNGNYLVATGAVNYGVTPWLDLGLNGTGRVIGNNKRGVGEAQVLEGGLQATFSPLELVDITLGGRFIVGTGTGFSGEDRKIQGIEGLFRISAHM